MSLSHHRSRATRRTEHAGPNAACVAVYANPRAVMLRVPAGYRAAQNSASRRAISVTVITYAATWQLKAGARHYRERAPAQGRGVCGAALEQRRRGAAALERVVGASQDEEAIHQSRNRKVSIWVAKTLRPPATTLPEPAAARRCRAVCGRPSPAVPSRSQPTYRYRCPHDTCLPQHPPACAGLRRPRPGLILDAPCWRWQPQPSSFGLRPGGDQHFGALAFIL